MTTDIITYIDENKDLMVDWVHEFFNGKYSREEVNHYLYGVETDGMPRNGVVKLSDEFNNLKVKTVDSIRQWYSDTDYYVFDLLPWNGCNMFKSKADVIVELIKKNGYETITDFGGGLGVLSAYISLKTNCKVVYVDLKDGVTFKFAQFLMNKLKINSVTIMGDEEYFSSDIVTDCIIATDCFEHIPNMQETFEKLIQHTNVIYHDSTFFSDKWSPQHVYTPKQLDFLNMCALYNFLPDQNNIKLLYRIALQFDENFNLSLRKV